MTLDFDLDSILAYVFSYIGSYTYEGFFEKSITAFEAEAFFFCNDFLN